MTLEFVFRHAGPGIEVTEAAVEAGGERTAAAVSSVGRGVAAAQPLHLPGLNGLRALAALAVVVSHLQNALPEFGLPEGTPLKLAEYGVTIFFALSGFLITYLLQVEAEVGEISIRKFYVRRVLRIWPLYYLNIAVVLLVLWATVPSSLPGSLAFYVFLGANIPFAVGTALPGLEHYWSIGVEEQFYLFWPWLVRRGKGLARLVLIFLICWVALRTLLRLHPTTAGWPYTLMFVTRFDCMAIGALGALFYYRQSPGFTRLTTSLWVQCICWGIVALLAANHFFVPLIGHDIVATATVCIIIAQITRRNRIISLDNAAAEFLGKISYGIYVIHPLVILASARLLRDWSPQMPAAKYAVLYAVVVGATVVVAHASYTLFEKPFLRRKERYATVQTAAAR